MRQTITRPGGPQPAAPARRASGRGLRTLITLPGIAALVPVLVRA
ncbi:hypothetical protein [Nonomuraea basaltis]|nr:hypothetical protein [Nonomuraea basaltis]